MDNKQEYLFQQFELLTLYKDFQTNIEELRKKYKLKEVCMLKNLVIDNLLLFEDRFFNADNLDKKLLREEYPVLKKIKLNCKYSLYDFEKEINNLIDKFNLNELFNYSLVKYIITNKIEIVDLDSTNLTYYINETDTKIRALQIRIFPETTIAEIRELFPKIKEWQSNELKKDRQAKRFRKLDNFKLHKEIWKLYNLKASIQEIVSEINKDSKIDVILGYSDVPYYVKKVKKRLFDR